MVKKTVKEVPDAEGKSLNTYVVRADLLVPCRVRIYATDLDDAIHRGETLGDFELLEIYKTPGELYMEGFRVESAKWKDEVVSLES